MDPAATSKADSDDTGIIAVGKDATGNYYVLGDYTIHATPQGWGETAITAYHKHKANLIIGETNNCGEMVSHTIKTIDSNIPFTAVHASRGKAIRRSL